VSASQKEKIYYDRREWSIRGIVLYICFIYLIFGVGVRLNIIIDAWWFLITGALPPLTSYSLRISIADSKMIFQQGFFFNSQEVSYDEIDRVLFRNSSKFDYGEKFWAWPWHWSFKNREFGSAPRDSQFVVKLNNSDYYIVRSYHAEEILSAIRKARPSIIIN